MISGLSAAKMLEETGCDMVMIGRGALGRPWVFAEINAYLNNEVILKVCFSFTPQEEDYVEEKINLYSEESNLLKNAKIKEI